VAFEKSFCPQEVNMGRSRSKVCGIDVHKKFLVATVLERNGQKKTEKFQNSLEHLLKLREWILAEECEVVAFESTGEYWIPLYDILQGDVEIIVANSYHIKWIPGKKTDTIDSEWIAELVLNDLIEPSRILPKEKRDIRSLTRLREKLVNERTDHKNRVHKILDSASIRLAAFFSDLFGKSGLRILKCILSGVPPEEIIQKLPKRLRPHSDFFLGAIQAQLSDHQLIQLQTSVTMIDLLNERIKELEQTILNALHKERRKLQVLMSIPGIGTIGATTLLAEIGDVSDFPSPDKLTKWVGITPRVYQSADKLHTGSITKQGSKHIRWILVEIAHSCIRTRNTVLRDFFDRIFARSGYKKAIVALARKILKLVWHLLTNDEMYQENNLVPKSPCLPNPREIGSISVSAALELLVTAGYHIIDRIDSSPKKRDLGT
jgi:transposase